MVNMQDHAACERAVMNLNNSYFFNSKLSVSFSKQDFVKIHPNPNELDDGTPSAKDYSNNKNNRFFSPDSVNKTRFSPPTKVSLRYGSLFCQYCINVKASIGLQYPILAWAGSPPTQFREPAPASPVL